MVYKIAVVVNPLTLKKSSKYQLPQHYNFHYDDFEHVKIKEPFKDTSKGRYILMYEVPKMKYMYVKEKIINYFYFIAARAPRICSIDAFVISI